MAPSPKPFRTKCQIANRTAKERQRGTAAQRGYGYRWQRYRVLFLQTPGNQFCKACLERDGKYEPAVHVDHIKAANGESDPLFWDESNHQPLCHACHSVKTVAVDGGFTGKL